VVELARLPAPLVEVSLVSGCCGVPVPDASIAVDGEDCGATGADGGPVSCCAKCGEHDLHADHSLVAPEGLRLPFTVNGSCSPCRVQVELPHERLRLVCRALGGAASTAAAADLWLVGGDLARWRRDSREAWLWDGELRDAETERRLPVQAGIAGRAELLRAGGCALARALAGPSCGRGAWRVVLHADGAGQETLECPMVRLARLSDRGAPSALWVARLAREAQGRGRTPTKGGGRLAVRTACCGRGFAGLEVEVDGEAAGATDDDGELELPAPESSAPGAGLQRQLRLQGAPSCLLPGGTRSLILRGRALLDFEVLCTIWVYCVPAERDEEEERDASEEEKEEDVDEKQEGEGEQEEGGTVFICVDSNQVPEEAQPVAGIFRCPGASSEEVLLDGQFIRPIALKRPSGSAGGCECLLTAIELDIKPPEGLVYRAKDPQPLAERCALIGGCELQRLVRCPAAMGYLEVPRQASLA